jgi:hypothetical protein
MRANICSNILNEFLRRGQRPALIGSMVQVGSWTTTPQE